MKKTPHSLKFGFLSLVILCWSFLSCSSTDGIDNYFTFNLEKNQFIINVTPTTAIGEEFVVTVPTMLDSVDLAKNGTSLSLLQSVKLTKLVLTSGDASFPMTSFDTVRLAAIADSLTAQLLALYSGASDAVSLTNADFAAYVKKTSSKFSIAFKLNKAPTQPVSITGEYTLVFSAKPQE